MSESSSPVSDSFREPRQCNWLVKDSAKERLTCQSFCSFSCSGEAKPYGSPWSFLLESEETLTSE